MSKEKEIAIPLFWDITRTVTHNCLFYFIVGLRGGGKSYSTKRFAVDRWIKTKKKFGYIRRYADDLTDSFKQFFDDISQEFPEYESKTVGKVIYIRKKPIVAEGEEPPEWTEDDIAGYGFVLSTANNKKSLSYSDVGFLMYDEFLMEEGNQRYLKKEPRALLNLYETIARPGTPGREEVPLFLLANTITITNPYFMYFNLKMPDPKNIDGNGKLIWKTRDNSMLVENVLSEGLAALKKEHKFGKIIAGTDYEDYSVCNQFLLDSEVFIEKRDPKSRHEFNFIYKGNKYGVWYSYKEGKMWISEAVDPYGLTYAMTMEDHSPNTMFLKSKAGSMCLKRFVECYKYGYVRFETMNIKNITYEVMKMILL